MWRGKGTWIALSVVVVSGAVLLAVARNDDPDHTTFCDAALRGAQVQLSPTELMTVVLQDQGQPGPGECDFEQFGREGDPVLGYDCKIRSFAGGVLGRAPANRPDGTCGQDSP